MARRVYVHLGLPKTGTTYLQTVMWSDRDLMREQGVLLPGRQRRDHLWSTRVIRDDPNLANGDDQQREAWEVVRAEVAEWPGTAVISHEFFAAASSEQATRMVADLAPAEVHLVVTAREPVGLFTGGWQESLKNRGSATLAEYAAEPVSESPLAIWNWRTLDVRLVLERWSPAVTPDRVHVLPLPKAGSPRSLLWERYAGLVGLAPDSFDLSANFANPSMGIVEAETLRRITPHLETPDFAAAFDRGVYIRTFLADERLASRPGERYWPSGEVVAECRQRAADAVDYIREQGFDVVGDLATLLVPDDLPERRSVDSVTDAEVAAVATELVATMLHDVRTLRRERNALRRELQSVVPVPVPPAWRRAASAVRRRLTSG